MTENNVTFAGTSGPNIWSQGPWQLCVWVDSGFKVWLSKRARTAVSPYFTQHLDLGQITCTNGKVNPIGSPILDDAHNCPVIGIDAQGIVHISRINLTPPDFIPMAIKSATSLTADNTSPAAVAWVDESTELSVPWAAATVYALGVAVLRNNATYVCNTAHTSSAAGPGGNEPGVGATWPTKWTPSIHSYNHYATFSDGELLWHHAVRQQVDGGNRPRWDFIYTRPVGSATWVNKGVVTAGLVNTVEALYVARPYIDANDRIHLFGLWSTDQGSGDGTDSTNLEHSYLYSDDRGTTWFAYDLANGGVPIQLVKPVTRGSVSGTKAQTGIAYDTAGAAQQHTYAAAVDKNGRACGTLAKVTAPFQGTHIIRWNGTGWTDDTSIFSRGGGQVQNLITFRNDLWSFGRFGNALQLRRVAAPNETINVVAPVVGSTVGSTATFQSPRFGFADDLALRDHDQVETLGTHNDKPRVWSFGQQARSNPTATPPPPPPPTVWDPVNKTGAVDATAQINTIITNTPDNSTVTFPPGIYLIGGQLVGGQYQGLNVTSRTGLNFVGTGVTLRLPYCGTITDGVISGGTNFHSNMALFTPRITGAKLQAASTAIIPANTTVTYVGPHDVTLSAAGTNGAVASATINPQYTQATARNRSFWNVQFGGGHEWSGFTMQGANPFAGTQAAAYSDNFEAQHAWNLGGTKGDGGDGSNISNGSGASIHDCTVNDIWGDFVYCSCPGGVGTRVCEDTRIHDNVFARNGRQCSSPQGVLRYRFDHNNVDQIRRAMFDMEPNGGNQTNRFVKIDNNTFGSNGLLFMAASGGTPFTVQEDINIHNNTSTFPYDIQWFGVPYVDVATTAALPSCTYDTSNPTHKLIATANGAFPQIDGVSLVVNSRVLVKNQVATQQNGPYRVLVVGTGGTPWQLQRCDDFASSAAFTTALTSFNGLTIYVLTGTANANDGRTCQTTLPFVIGTTPQTWSHNPGTGPGTGPWALTRKRWTFTNNTTTAQAGSPLGMVHEFRYISDVTETGNTQPLQVRSNPTMVFSDLTHCRGTINITGNTLAPVNPNPQFRTDSNPVPQGLSFPVGFAIGAGLPNKVGSVYPEIDAEKAAGAKFIRISAGWDSVDSAHNGTFTATNALNGVIAYCNTIGLDVILILGQSGTAPWQNNMYSYIPEYAAMAVQAAAYFDGSAGKKLLALELGNEPNHDKWDSTVIGSQKGDRYAQILIRVFDPAFGNVRAVNPGLDVIVGGLGGEAASGNGIDSFTFTQNVHGVHTVAGNPYTITLNSHYDGWNSHPYCYYTLPSVDTTGGWDNLKDIMAWFQTTYAGTPPLWVTEFGWPTDEHLSGGINPSYDADCQDAADALDDIAALLEAQTWDVRCLAWFCYMNNNKVPDVGHDNYFGIVEYDADFISSPAKPHIAAEFQIVATGGLGGQPAN